MFLNLVYGVAMVLLAPWLVIRSIRTGRYRQNLRPKLFGCRPPVDSHKPVVWFHGVSVGEVHLLRQVVRDFQKRHPAFQCVVSASTDTGLAEARKHFADLTVFPFPLDFTWAVRKTMSALSPRLIVLAESEMWPNFLQIAQRFHVPVAVINGRMSPRSARRFARFAPIVRRALFDRVARFGMQSEAYANNLRSLGVAEHRLRVTGSVKYDASPGDRRNSKTQQLGAALGVRDTDLIWVAGSTHDPEERIAIAVYGRLRARFPGLKLILVPRAPERFDEVAALIAAAGLPCVRRSQRTEQSAPANGVILIDTLGELGAAWGLATVGFTGGSVSLNRGGQSMIEPAGYGVPVTFGPNTWNFKDAVAGLLDAGGAIRVHDEAELERELTRLLGDPVLRDTMGQAARGFVASQLGATQRTLDMLDELVK